MATLANIKGRFIVQVQIGKHRRTIGLGRMADRHARLIRSHIDQLANAIASNTSYPMETAAWLKGISDRLYGKISKTGLIPPRVPAGSMAIGAYFQTYITKRTDLKQNTIENLRQVKAFAVKHFGEKRELSSISRGDVKDWHRALLAEYAQATVAMHVKKMRQLFADAIDRKLIDENPFRAVKAGSMRNAERMRYVPLGDIEKVIDACPDREWRLLFALARYAGLRVPSETLALRWEDIDWQGRRFTVRSAKTEHHEGKSRRTVPIFPELYDYLVDAWDGDGAGLVFAKLRGPNNSTTGRKIIERAGLTPWPKTFQNLRASCETDLASQFPLHVACAWIGNSTGIAVAHYLQVTDDHFESASESAALRASVSAGQYRTSSDQTGEKTPAPPNESRKPLPPRGVESDRDFNEKLQRSHRALQAALHDGKSYLFSERKRLIDNLAAKVESARSLTAPSGEGEGAS